MIVRMGGEDREVVAVMQTVDESGEETAVYWTLSPGGALEAWPAASCEVVG